jgi:transposase
LFWTTKLAHSYIEKTYHVTYSFSQVRNILHSMGMACIKPRPHHRKANKKAQEEFKTCFKKRVVEYVEKGYKVFFIDEVTFPVAPYITYGWFKKGSKPVIKYLHNRKKKHRVLGALSKDHFFHQFTEENFNSNVFEQFLLLLIEKFGKVVIVIDQARYHTSYHMQEFYELYKEILHVEYFPSYSPELNPAEQVWRKVKRWLGFTLWTNKDELKEQIITAFESGLARVPIYEYLLV